MGVDLPLREATPDDAAALAALHVETFRETHGGGPTIAVREDQWQRILSANDDLDFTLIVEGDVHEPVGFARGTRHKNLLADLSGELADAKLRIADLKERVALQAQEIQALKRANPTTKQKPCGVKWGCYQFEGEDGLFCTGCYDARGVKSRTNRLDSRHRSCPVCGATIGS